MQNKSAIVSKAPIEFKMSLPCLTSSLVDDLEVAMAEDQDAQDMFYTMFCLSTFNPRGFSVPFPLCAEEQHTIEQLSRN